MNYRAWQVDRPNEDKAKSLALAIGAPRLLARVLVARGLSQPQQAMALLMENEPLSDPFLLKDMDKAVERIAQAIDGGEPIVIYGDYDVDGVTATALLYSHLANMGARVRCKLPRREGEGYGLHEDSLRALAEKGYRLVITVDNGISAVQEAAAAKALGLDLIITDHHLPGEQLPAAVAVVDPKRPDDPSPYKDLSGAGVAFKLCAALEGCPPEELLDYCADLATLGTVADVMPLTGENRTLVKAGLQSLQNTERPGLAALLQAAGLSEKPVTAESIGFGLAPRLNAAGRMGSAVTALKLLLCEDPEQAAQLAAQLCQLNQQRQAEEQAIMQRVEQQLQQNPERALDRVVLVWDEGYHPGVIGIVASRLTERTGRPSIVVTIQNGVGRGSGRSVPGFDLHAALEACAEHMEGYGGHAAAAGLTVQPDKLPALRQALNEWAAREYPLLEPPALHIDVPVQLSELSVEEVEGLAYLAPCGNGNPAPLFVVENAQIEGVYAVSEGKHSRLRLRQGGASLYAALFGTGPQQLAYHPGDRVDVALTLSVFEGRNGKMLSGRVTALRPAGLDNAVSRQAALYDAFAGGLALTEPQRALLTPTRADTVALYRLVQQGQVCGSDLQPLFARLGAGKTACALVGLTALTQLGLVQCDGDGHYAAANSREKKNLADAPILRRLGGIVEES